MITRLVVLVLLGLLIAGLIRKWTRPVLPRDRRGTTIESARRCPECGAYVLAGEVCACTRGQKRDP